MKNLVIIRHAKSSWETQTNDHDRPLDKSGVKRAEEMSEKYIDVLNLKEYQWYSSTANRAMSTARIFQKRANSVIILPKEELYTFSIEDLLKSIQKFPDIEDFIVIFGHNPAFTELANFIGDFPIEDIPTCGIVQIEIPSNSWKNLEKGSTKRYLTHNFEFDEA